MYRYGKAAWVTTDAAFGLADAKRAMSDFLVYSAGDTVKCLIVDEKSRCIYEASFIEPGTMVADKTIRRKLDDKEKKMLKLKEKALYSVANRGYAMQSYEDYNLNPIFLPDPNGYKMYMVSGTSQPLTVPMGNDYLFYTDKKGKVTSWKQFHKKLLPIKVLQNVSIPIHKHTAEEPFISATDIFTFRMYTDKTNLTEFAVYSPEISSFFIYNKETNTITVSDKIPTNEEQ